MDLVTAEEYADLYGPATDATALDAVIPLASSLVRSRTRQMLTQGTDTVYFNVRDDWTAPKALWLPQRPVTAVASVSVTPAGGVTTVLAATAYSWDEEGRLARIDGQSWPVGPRTVAVTYTHGYDPTPDDIRLVTLGVIQRALGASWAATNGQGTGATGAGAGGGTATTPALTDADEAILGQYRRVAVA